MTPLKILKFDFSATISDINAQFAPVNKGLNSASIRLQQKRKYFWYAPMTSLKCSKFNFTAAVDNIYVQFASVFKTESLYFNSQKFSTSLCVYNFHQSFIPLHTDNNPNGGESNERLYASRSVRILRERMPHQYISNYPAVRCGYLI